MTDGFQSLLIVSTFVTPWYAQKEYLHRGARISKIPQLVCHDLHGLDIVNQRQTKSTKIQPNF